jgi:hypothetical protein
VGGSSSPRKAGRGRGLIVAFLIAAALAGMLAYAVWGFQAMWRLGDDVQLSVHGWIAMGLAFVLTGLLGGGLMWLAFYSARKGYDDEAGKEEE